jgi:GTP-binding protein
VRRELSAYGADLDAKPEIVALSKIDAVDAEHLKKQRERLKRAMASAGPADRAERTAPLLLSAATGAGVTEALRALLAVIDEHRRVEQAPTEEAEWRP